MEAEKVCSFIPCCQLLGGIWLTMDEKRHKIGLWLDLLISSKWKSL